MLSYLLRRFAQALVTLLGISLLVFVLVRAVPGDPALVYAGGLQTRSVSPEVLAQVRASFHLDEPVPAQYLRWLGNVVRLDFGESFSERRPVRSAILERLPRTLLLNGMSLLVALLIAFPAAVISARRKGAAFDRASAIVAFLLISIPPFWLAILLIQLFAVKLQWFTVLPSLDPASAGIRELLLPVVALAAAQCAFYARFIRSTLLEAAGHEHIRTARAKGLSESTVFFRHTFRNAILPNLTILGLTIPALFSGSVIVERLFQWDGIGRLFFSAMLTRDYPMIMGLTMLAAMVTLLSMLAIDLLYAILDPRISLEGEAR